MADLADKLTQTTYLHPRARIYLADSLTDFSNRTGGDRTFRLHLDQLALKAAPEIDSATLTYYRGPQIPFQDIQLPGEVPEFEEDEVNPDDYLDQWIKIEIPDTVGNDDVIWFGFIDTVESQGGSVGAFKVQAVGLLKLAEHSHIRTAHALSDDGSEILELGVSLPFNRDDRNAFSPQGNRSANKQSEPFPHYIFAYENRRRDTWTAHEAVEYLLARHAPKDSLGDAIVAWVIDIDNQAAPVLDWYQCVLTTEGKSLKQLLDELIPRKRAVSYYVAYDDVAQRVVLTMFTFVADRIEMTDPGTTVTPEYLEANPNQLTVTLDESIWIQDVECTESTDSQYDRIIAQGERCTSTCSLSFEAAKNQFVPDWTAAEELAYKTAGGLGRDARTNAQLRSTDKYGHVYCRFKLSDTWDGLIDYRKLDEDADPDYWADPLLDADGNPKQPNEVGSAAGQVLRVRGIRLLRSLPLKDRVDYYGTKLTDGSVFSQLGALVAAGENDPEDIPPMFFLYDETADQFYTPLDKLAASSTADTDKTLRRNWSVHVSISRYEPSVQLHVTSKRQTLIARDKFLTPPPIGAYDATWDPQVQNGFNYTQIRATVCIEFERRLTIDKDIRVAPTSRQEKILYLDAKDARLDYMAPKTLVSTSVPSSDYLLSEGGWIRDDRPRIRALVNATAEWFSRLKSALRFSVKQPRKLCSIGDLITAATGLATVDGIRLPTVVNTPVTSITYTMGSDRQGGQTKIETGFAEIDFA